MITYNHERFIAQAVDSVLSQETSIPFEVVIGNDCSRDNTGVILQRFAQNHPKTIRLLNRDTNLGAAANFLDVIRHCRGDFIAILEGDDFWTTTDRLNRQVQFLDTNPECSMCFGRANYLNENTRESLDGAVGPSVEKRYYDLDDLLEFGNFVPTASVLLRKAAIDWRAFAIHSLALPIGDFLINFLAASAGPLGYINEVFYTYRAHSGGTFSSRPKASQLLTVVQVYQYLGEHYDLRSRSSFRVGLSRAYFDLFCTLERNGGIPQWTRAALGALNFAPGRRKPAVAFGLAKEVYRRLVGKVVERSA